MSAIFALCSADVVHVLSDAATTATKEGRIVALAPKQAALRNGVLVAGIGLWPPVAHFARLADELATFDDVTRAAPELWAEVRERMPAAAKDVLGVTAFAGWSDERERMVLHFVQWPDAFTYDVPGYAGGPSADCAEFASNFGKPFVDEPASFDPSRDGVQFFEMLRRRHFRDFDDGKHPAVGGWVDHSIVTREGAETRVIHTWPSDTVGRLIDPDATAPAGEPWGTALDMRVVGDAVERQFGQFGLAKIREIAALELAQEEAASIPYKH
jgi:hypothetical protein